MSRWRSNCRSRCSCDSPASFLSRRKTFPKAIAGSKKFSQYTGRDVRLTLSFGLHNILVICRFTIKVATISHRTRCVGVGCLIDTTLSARSCRAALVGRLSQAVYKVPFRGGSADSLHNTQFALCHRGRQQTLPKAENINFGNYDMPFLKVSQRRHIDSDVKFVASAVEIIGYWWLSDNNR